MPKQPLGPLYGAVFVNISVMISPGSTIRTLMDVPELNNFVIEEPMQCSRCKLRLINVYLPMYCYHRNGDSPHILLLDYDRSIYDIGT